MFLYLQRSAMVCPAGEDASQVTRGDDIACFVERTRVSFFLKGGGIY